MTAKDREPPERLIKLPEVIDRVGLGKTMIYQNINEGTFPARYKLSPFASRWSEQEICDWIEEVKGFRPAGPASRNSAS